ncbi:DUF4147 domain-containing protein [Nitrococcus mobilis]|uniref:MOFRL family protein n=1 Tax=Nitrococcus mobilis Nb-231 TaxID=314278 RepID=A4BRW4_9GAMM|nr:DUF4147 domain-containing protein [Nitrococcus mobilis]EAR21443.1 MOFRL family protein [Nitrococcus mobilis Nb-231]
MNPREALLAIYQAGLDAVRGDRCVRRWLRQHPCDNAIYAIAIGKAAAAMARGALAVCDRATERVLVITRAGYGDPGLASDPRVEQLESAHPVPDTRSLVAGERLVRFLEAAPEQVHLLVMISGGASSLVELLPDGASPERLAELNRRLLASGFAIHEINRIRKAVSRIKGGRLARWVAGRPTTVLLISDVRDDDPAVIGSGLLSPDSQASGLATLPLALRRLCPPAEPAPRANEALFQSIQWQLVASNRQARAAAVNAAHALGLPVSNHEEFISGEAAVEGRRIAEELVYLSPGVHIWGGEPTVSLPENPGRGGRMQTLALAAAMALAGRDDIWLLAAGTDGADGFSEDAGALIDGQTVSRGSVAGGNVNEALFDADAGGFLAGSGDLIRTGATGTNVMDLIIGLRAA